MALDSVGARAAQWRSDMRRLAFGLAVALVVALLAAAVQPSAATAVETDLEGPYEDIQSLLTSAAASSSSLAALDSPRRHPSRHRPARIVEIHHTHEHLVPHDLPRHVAQRIAEENTPAPPPVRIVSVPNRARAARHQREDAAYARDTAKPTITTVDVQHTVAVSVPVPSSPPKPLEYTIKAPVAPAGTPPSYEFPLVDRTLKRPTFSIVADMDGSEKAGSGKSTSADFKPHTAAELQAEAKKLLARAKKLKAAAAKKNGKEKAAAEAMGVFDSKDVGYEDELTRLKRVSARMNRLREQIEVPHNQDTFEGSIARKKYFLKLYRQLKADATKIIEGYALRTGHSIFETFGDGQIDPSLAAFLPPNSVAAILAQYANPTQGRGEGETPRDVISGKDAKRIQYTIDAYHAKRAKRPVPPPPTYALSDAEERVRDLKANRQNPEYNKVVATQEGAFGQGRPTITTGAKAVGRSAVHLHVVNPTPSQATRGLPYQVNLVQPGTNDAPTAAETDKPATAAPLTTPAQAAAKA